MDDVLIELMKQRNERYKVAARLTNVFEKYEASYDAEDELVVEVMNSNGIVLPLPSGEEGNQLGLALQLGALKSIRYMMKNAEYLGIDLDKVIVSPVVKDADETYEYYKDFYDEAILTGLSVKNIKKRKRPINA